MRFTFDSVALDFLSSALRNWQSPRCAFATKCLDIFNALHVKELRSAKPVGDFCR